MKYEMVRNYVSTTSSFAKKYINKRDCVGQLNQKPSQNTQHVVVFQCCSVKYKRPVCSMFSNAVIP